MLCTLYKPSILACCSNVPYFTANRERRRPAGQLAAQKNARYKDSYLCAFDPARPLHFESWVQRDMQKGFTDELQRLRPRRCQFWGNDGLPPRHPLKVRPWLKGNTRAIAASATKKRLSLSLQPMTWTLDLCRTNSRVSLRQRRCSSPKAVPSYVSIALKDSEGTTVTPLTWRRISAVS